MHVQLQKIGNSVGVLLSVEQAEALNLSEGDTVEVIKAGSDGHVVRASLADSLASYKASEPAFAEAYRELAK